jgi:preprotein translocase subunit SecF
MRFFHDTKIDFVGKRKMFFIVSLVLNVVGLLGAYILGPQFGIDFTGGTEIAVAFKSNTSIEDIRNIFESKKIEAEIKSYGALNQYLIRIQDSENPQTTIDNTLGSKYEKSQFEILSISKIGPKVGNEMRSQAIWAVLLSIIAILLYIAFRFEFIYGLGAIFALIHDVIITFTGIIIINKLGILHLEINQSILAAMLTVIGFSINDTVIIFDRIRENRLIYKGMHLDELINLSVNETLSRTINTVLVVVLVLLSVVIFGGPVLQGFGFTMLIGIVIGTYSSIYIASSYVIWYIENISKEQVTSNKVSLTK